MRSGRDVRSETFAAACSYFPETGRDTLMNDTDEQRTKTSTRGFASMDPQRQREIARKGGESVPNEKRSFSQDPSLAAQAGRKGGQSVNPNKRSFSQDHALAAEAGRKGGHASHGVARKNPQAAG